MIAYAAVPLVALYLIYRITLGKIKARTAIFFTAAFVFVFMLCFIGGAAVSFMYEPHSYWTSMKPDFWDIQHDTLLGYFALTPYEFSWMVVKAMVYILATHFTWAFAGFYGVGGYIMWNWALAAIYAKRIRDPEFGFGSDDEMARFRRILRAGDRS